MSRSTATRTAWVLGLVLLSSEPALAQVLYPPAPAPPRIQFLGKIHSEADLRPRPNWFLRFLFGRQLEDQWLRNALQRPYSVAFREGELLVSDSQAGSHWRLDPQAGRMSLEPAPPGSGAGGSVGLCILADGGLALSDTRRQEVMVLDARGRFRQVLGRGLLERPAGLAVDGDTLFVADTGANRVWAFSLSDGGGRRVLGADRPEDSPVGAPTNLAFAPDGSFYVSETLAARVSRYSRDGGLVRIVAERGPGAAQVAAPKGLAVDREGRLFVADARFEQVKVFDDAGRLLMVFGRSGAPESDLSLPAGLALGLGPTPYWQAKAAAGFRIEYLIAVVGQFDPAAVYVYGFGRQDDVEYPPPAVER